MLEQIFDLEQFNIISDEDNYYFFRALEDGDIIDKTNVAISIIFHFQDYFILLKSIHKVGRTAYVSSLTWQPDA